MEEEKLVGEIHFSSGGSREVWLSGDPRGSSIRSDALSTHCSNSDNPDENWKPWDDSRKLFVDERSLAVLIDNQENKVRPYTLVRVGESNGSEKGYEGFGFYNRTPKEEEPHASVVAVRDGLPHYDADKWESGKDNQLEQIDAANLVLEQFSARCRAPVQVLLADVSDDIDAGDRLSGYLESIQDAFTTLAVAVAWEKGGVADSGEEL
jgi:hypothetical protein